ncbi:hypothetical protein DUI87_32160 [Hirundo rustica rustica]|uniref:Uncharacterized protein n=1 Tax=Hirundo rustica rustica TaxID=333673 RepID=A0A3M0IY03_HIRRU|nr:hypothetical protein DUI87_32160 [Hirundo rustica rustica]
MAKALCSLQLAKDSSGAERFVCHRQPELWSPQGPMREAALGNGTGNGTGTMNGTVSTKLGLGVGPVIWEKDQEWAWEWEYGNKKEYGNRKHRENMGWGLGRWDLDQEMGIQKQDWEYGNKTRNVGMEMRDWLRAWQAEQEYENDNRTENMELGTQEWQPENMGQGPGMFTGMGFGLGWEQDGTRSGVTCELVGGKGETELVEGDPRQRTLGTGMGEHRDSSRAGGP